MATEAFKETAFSRQTTVVPDPGVPGRYRATMSDQWNAPVLPQGGITTAIALRAMVDELGLPDQALRSVTTVFAAQVPSGPLEIDVTVLRRGRTMSQATATVRPAGEAGEGGQAGQAGPAGPAAGHTAMAVFGDARQGFEFTEAHPPEVPPPDQCRSFRDPLPDGVVGFPPASFWDRVESRVGQGHAPWEAWEPTTSDRVYWYRFDEPPVGDDGTWDPLALVVLCDTMPGAVGERMGGGQPTWFGPSADLTVHVLGQARSAWLLAHNRAHFAGGGYASVEMTLWDPAHGLVAYATQLMFFSFPDGGPLDREGAPGGR